MGFDFLNISLDSGRILIVLPQKQLYLIDVPMENSIYSILMKFKLA